MREPVWLQYARRITPWVFYSGSALFFLACALQYLRGAEFNMQNFLSGALMAVVPGLIRLVEERMK